MGASSKGTGDGSGSGALVTFVVSCRPCERGVASQIGVRVTRPLATRGKWSSSWSRARAAIGTTALAALGVGGVGCGDAMLPSDYVGPPAATTTGNVVLEGVASRDAERPRLTLEWLLPEAENSTIPLVGQPLRFARSMRIQNDWDIGLETPIDRAKRALPDPSGQSRTRIAVGKMVYFDDRDDDGRVDWTCGQASTQLGDRIRVCDQVKAVSREFVAFVEGSPGCALGPRGDGRRLAPGYHYFRIVSSPLGGLSAQELGPDEPMSFSLGDRTLLESNPTEELRSFGSFLVRVLSSSSLPGC